MRHYLVFKKMAGKPDAITILGILVLIALAIFVAKDFVLSPGPYSNSNRAGSERGVAVEGAPSSGDGVAPEVSPQAENGVPTLDAGGQYITPTYSPGGAPDSQDFGDDSQDAFGTPTPQPTLFPSATPTPTPVVQQASGSRSIRIDEETRDYNA